MTKHLFFVLCLFGSCSFGQDTLNFKWRHDFSGGINGSYSVRAYHQIQQNTMRPGLGYSLRYTCHRYISNNSTIGFGLSQGSGTFYNYDYENNWYGAYLENPAVDTFVVSNSDYFVDLPISLNMSVGNSRLRWEFGFGIYFGVQFFNQFSRQLINKSLYYNGFSYPNEIQDNWRFKAFAGGSVSSKLLLSVGRRTSITLMTMVNHDFFSRRKSGIYSSIPINRFNRLLSLEVGFSRMMNPENIFSNPLSTNPSNQRRNAIFLEAMGIGLLYSLNYERRLINRAFLDLNFRLGYSYWTPYADNIMSFPFGFNFTIGDHVNKGEIGISHTPVYDSELEWNIFGLTFGYRLESNDNFLFRINFNPMIEFNYDFGSPWIGRVLPYGGLSFGGRF